MKKQYSCELWLGKTHSSALPTPQDLAETCKNWLTAKKRAGVTSIESLPKKIDLKIERQVFSLGEKADVKVVSCIEENYWGFAIKFTHPDSSDPQNLWIIEICISGNSGEVKVSIVTYVTHTSGAIRPIQIIPSQPRIIKEMINRWGARELIEIKLTPNILNLSAIDSFLALLTNANRKLPILLISCAMINDWPLVNATEISEQLAGLCHVFVAQDRWVSSAIKNQIGESLSCWNGAIRIYWPGFSDQDSSFNHRLWTPGQIKDIQGGSAIPLGSYLLGYILEVASARQTQSDVTWGYIENKLQQRDLVRLKESGDLDKLFDAFAEQCEQLKVDKRQLEDELIKAIEEQEKLKYEAESWKNAYLILQREGSDDHENINLPPTSVEQVKRRIENEYGEKIVFSLNGQSCVEGNPFEDCVALYNAIKFLGTTYFDSKIGKKSCEDLDLDIRNGCGFFYSANQSKVTVGRFPDDYYTTWNGEKIFLKSHIGKGTSKDQRYCIRVAFEFLEEEKKILIGYIGQHQTTSAS